MQGFFAALIGTTMLATALPAAAQEVVVTASRSRGYDTGAPAPAISLRRTADFAVLKVSVTGDTRDPAKRSEEIYAMIRGAIVLAQKAGIELATGDSIVEALTLANYQNLILADGDRNDSQEASFLVKAGLNQGGDAKAALDRIAKFVRDVPAVGRAEMKTEGELTLSVVNPEQYRGEIIRLIAADSSAGAAQFGAGYGVQVQGLERRVQWGRASLTEIFLYLPVSYAILPMK